MIKEIIQQWEANKHRLEEYFRNTNQSEYSEYVIIVSKIFELCLNDDNTWDYKHMTVINDGDYQGTLLFIIPKNTYQPSVSDYIMTDTYYGSCSGCDTLQGICDYDSGKPTLKQLSGYMTLSLHLVQKIRKLTEEDDE